MTDGASIKYVSNNEEQTKALGRVLARFAHQGDAFALFGTLGMGKSVLARAFIQELTAANEVPSPTFTLLQSYEAPEFEIYHFDLYRLKSPEEIFEIGMEEALYEGVSLIEWPEQMGAYLPKNLFRLEFVAKGQGREIIISSPDHLKQQRLVILKEQLDD